jgi:3-oxosteroid 1-dehydrogenase
MFDFDGPELRREAATVFDSEADVVVVGTGAAGYAAAIAAVKGGAGVIQLEKAEEVGGTSKKAAGGFWVPNNHLMRAAGLEDPKEDALRYMARLTGGDRYDPAEPHLGLTPWEYEMAEAFFDNAAGAVEALTGWGAVDPVCRDTIPDYYAELPENVAPYGRVLVPHLVGGEPGEFGGSADMMITMVTAAEGVGVDVRTGHRVTALVISDDDEVVGVVASAEAGEVALRAAGAVILATGGFSHDVDRRDDSLPGPIFGGCAAKTNTGDVLPLARALGADLVNMDCAWMAPMVLDRAIADRPDSTCSFAIAGDSMIFVNRFGRRAVNEKAMYYDVIPGFWARESSDAEFENRVLVMLWDEACKERYASELFGNPMTPDGGDQSHIVSAGTLEELEPLIRGRLEHFATEVDGLQLDDSFLAGLRETIDRFNGFAERGADEDFHRGETAIERFFNLGGREGNQGEDKNETMWPISARGPYHATLLAPAAIDTKGGPRTNTLGQMLTGEGEPIPGLYAVGNCAGQMSGHAFWAGGATLGPHLTFGFIAGRTAAAQPVRN